MNLKALGDAGGGGWGESWASTPTQEDLPFSLVGLLSINSIRVRVL